MRSAGVLRNVAADGAGSLAGRVRRVEIFLALDGECDIQIDDTRLHHGAFVFEVNLQDPVHPGEGDGHAGFAWNSASTQAGAGATADDGDIVRAGDLYDRHYIFS